MKSNFRIICLSAAILSLAGCGEKEEKSNAAVEQAETKEEQKTVDYKNIKLPQTVEELVAFPFGKYGKVDEKKQLDDATLQEIADEVAAINVDGLSDEEKKEVYMSALFSLTKREMAEENVQAVFKETEAPTITEEEKKLFKENYNVEIILDASGSMAGKVDGEQKMEAAKKAINQFASSLPKEANISLTVYGHKGSNEEKDKEASCSQIDTVYSNQKYDDTKFSEALNTFKPTGWTPLTGALEKSLQNFVNSPGDKNTNIIYVVSDGIETCGGNPVEVATKMKDSNIQPIVNIIGFDVDDEAQKQLKEIAGVTKGKYIQANNVKELNEEFKTSADLANKWKYWAIDNELKAWNKGVTGRLELSNIATEWRHTVTVQWDFIKFTLPKIIEKKQYKYAFQESLESEFYRYFTRLKETISNEIDMKVKMIEQKEKEFDDRLKEKAKQHGG
jgi:Ca-activated chloride channel homolog